MLIVIYLPTYLSIQFFLKYLTSYNLNLNYIYKKKN